MLEIAGLRVSYGPVEALRGVDLEVIVAVRKCLIQGLLIRELIARKTPVNPIART